MKSPAFQFYPKDWLASRSVRLMTDQQRGWYIQLLCEAWESEVQGTLPNDPKILWKLAGAASEQVFNACSTPVLQMFRISGDQLIHDRLVREIVKQKVWSEHCSNAGKLSAEKRRQAIKDQHLNRGNTCSNSVEPKSNRTVEPKSNIAVCSLQFASSTPYKKRLNLLFKRRDSTEWSSKEQKVLNDLTKRPEFESELSEIEKRYTSGAAYLRQDIQTLLNNWSGELDRARNQSNGNAVKPPLLRPSFSDLQAKGAA
jgi:uncharacterized protein YdaU (DUF1376 family)